MPDLPYLKNCATAAWHALWDGTDTSHAPLADWTLLFPDSNPGISLGALVLWLHQHTSQEAETQAASFVSLFMPHLQDEAEWLLFPYLSTFQSPVLQESKNAVIAFNKDRWIAAITAGQTSTVLLTLTQGSPTTLSLARQATAESFTDHSPEVIQMLMTLLKDDPTSDIEQWCLDLLTDPQIYTAVTRHDPVFGHRFSLAYRAIFNQDHPP